MSIYDNVVYGLRIYGIKKKEVFDEIVESSFKKVYLWDEVKDRLRKSVFLFFGG